MSIVSKKKIGAIGYYLLYVVTMMIVVSMLFMFFPPVKDFMYSWFPNQWIRYGVIFAIIGLIPVLGIMGWLIKLGTFGSFKVKGTKGAEKNIAKVYFVSSLLILFLLMFVIIFMLQGAFYS